MAVMITITINIKIKAQDTWVHLLVLWWMPG